MYHNIKRIKTPLEHNIQLTDVWLKSLDDDILTKMFEVYGEDADKIIQNELRKRKLKKINKNYGKEN